MICYVSEEKRQVKYQEIRIGITSDFNRSSAFKILKEISNLKFWIQINY